MLGSAAGENRGAFCELEQVRVAEAVDLIGDDRHAGVDVEIPADLRGGRGVVTGEDLDRDAATSQGGERVRGTGRERVTQPDETEEGQAMLVAGAMIAVAGGPLGKPDGKQPQALPGLLLGEAAQPIPGDVVQASIRTGCAHLGAPFQHGLDGALDHQRVRSRTSGAAHHRTGDAAYRIEGQRGHALVFVQLLGGIQNRLVKGVRRREIGKLQRP